MRGNFEACLAEVLKHEGGYVDHPRDPGGATNMGITHATLASWRGRAVTKADVRALTRAEAALIYRARYWNAVRGDDLPAGLDLVAFDAAVNSGVSRGARWLQQAVGAVADGKIGPATIAAAQRVDANQAVSRACDIRLAFLRGLSTWTTFGRGWTRRVDNIRDVAMRMAAAKPAPQVIHKPALPPKPTSEDGAQLSLGILFGLAILAAAAFFLFN